MKRQNCSGLNFCSNCLTEAHGGSCVEPPKVNTYSVSTFGQAFVTVCLSAALPLCSASCGLKRNQCDGLLKTDDRDRKGPAWSKNNSGVLLALHFIACVHTGTSFGSAPAAAMMASAAAGRGSPGGSLNMVAVSATQPYLLHALLTPSPLYHR